nr:helix-turn-helix transcriptional regulator [Sphingobium subterraneum]
MKEAEKSCLRLVAQNMTSKEIAQKLRLSPATVDTYLKSATAKLSGQNRRDAARIFLQFEHSQLLGSQSEPLVIPSDSGAIDGPTEISPPSVSRNGGQGWRTLLPPGFGGKINDTTTGQRITAAIKIAFWSVTVFIALVLFLSQALKALA